ncbi:MAG: mannose-1-phosphate guanylyltransferase [Myxococcota bacterium]|jgi:mannose-1-phosphate guanylyltransferase
MDHRYAMIMAGGSGTRFWPLSRESRPKQFFKIGGHKPLITQTYDRLLPLLSKEQIGVVAGKVHQLAIVESLDYLELDNLILEPMARNTAPAIGLASMHLYKRDPDAVVAVIPSDQHIGDTAGFVKVLSAAFDSARNGSIVTLGITPTRPETGYGYILKGASIGVCDSFEVFGVEAFVEKPDRPRAMDYVMSGRYLWNAGIFIFRAESMLKAIEQHIPEVYVGLREIGDAIGTDDLDAVTARAFQAMPSISIDYGVMEKSGGIRVIPAPIVWSDVGSWASIPEISEVDASGNTIRGDTIVVDSGRCVISSDAQLTAVVGMEETAIIVTADAILVCPLDRTQDVRKVVEQLKSKGRIELL